MRQAPAAPDASIDRFIDALWLEDGLSANTLAAYRRDLALYARWLGQTHGAALAQSSWERLEAVARKRGCLLKGRGGEPDLEKASLLLLTDYRAGVLGRISLETPQTREAMLAAASAASKAGPEAGSEVS